MKFDNNLFKFAKIYVQLLILFITFFECESTNLNLLHKTLKSQKLSKNQILNIFEKLNLSEIDVRELLSLDNSTFSNSELSVLDYNLLPQLFFGDKKFRSNKNGTFPKEEHLTSNIIAPRENLQNNDTFNFNDFSDKNISKFYAFEPNNFENTKSNEKSITKIIGRSSNQLQANEINERFTKINKEIKSDKNYLTPLYMNEFLVSNTGFLDVKNKFNLPMSNIQLSNNSNVNQNNLLNKYSNKSNSEEQNIIINNYLNSLKEKQQDKLYLSPKSSKKMNKTSDDKHFITPYKEGDSIINKDFKYSANETKNKLNVLNDEKHKDRYLNSSSKTYKIENKKLIINIEEYDLQEILVLEK